MEHQEIKDEAGLRELYAPPSERVQQKTLRQLDQHCIGFIARSPFLCLGTAGESSADVSPRGDSPGFVKVLNPITLAIPDWPGNNRMDTFNNIVQNPQVGILFLVPGVDETLRVNGTAQISINPELLALWNVNGKHPKAAVMVTVTEAFLHCGKALIRAKLWRDDYKIGRGELPTLGQMIKDQTNTSDTAQQIEAAVAEAYVQRLY